MLNEIVVFNQFIQIVPWKVCKGRVLNVCFGGDQNSTHSDVTNLNNSDAIRLTSTTNTSKEE